MRTSLRGGGGRRIVGVGLRRGGRGRRGRGRRSACHQRSSFCACFQPSHPFGNCYSIPTGDPIRNMDVVSAAKRSEIMRRVKCESTGPEMAVRRLIHSLGFRYRLHRRDLPGCPDLVFPRLNKIIFVHGCFWHQHRCPRAARPESRCEYWNKKLDGNLRRDRRNKVRLNNSGWSILVIWECQIKQSMLPKLTRRILRFLQTQ